MYHKGMGDSRNDKASAFFTAMGGLVSEQRARLTDSQGMNGTDLDIVDLLSLRKAYNQFEAECVPALAAGRDCTTVFNTSAGKRLRVDVSYTEGVKVGIIPKDEAAVKREVSFRLP